MINYVFILKHLTEFYDGKISVKVHKDIHSTQHNAWSIGAQ